MTCVRMALNEIMMYMCHDGRMRIFCRTHLGYSWTTARLQRQCQLAAEARAPLQLRRAQQAAHS